MLARCDMRASCYAAGLSTNSNMFTWCCVVSTRLPTHRCRATQTQDVRQRTSQFREVALLTSPTGLQRDDFVIHNGAVV